MLLTRDDSLEAKTRLVSGSGNVAQYTIEKLLDMGAKAVTLSDSTGFVHDPAGIENEKLAWVMELKNERRGRISEYAEHFPGATFTPFDPTADANPLWSVPADCAFPSATENEINAKDAANLPRRGRIRRERGRQHADLARGRRSVRERRDPLRPGQGRERRRRRRLGPGDGPGLAPRWRGPARRSTPG